MEDVIVAGRNVSGSTEKSCVAAVRNASSSFELGEDVIEASNNFSGLTKKCRVTAGRVNQLQVAASPPSGPASFQTDCMKMWSRRATWIWRRRLWED